jgi:hypothetical protein
MAKKLRAHRSVAVWGGLVGLVSFAAPLRAEPLLVSLTAARAGSSASAEVTVEVGAAAEAQLGGGDWTLGLGVQARPSSVKDCFHVAVTLDDPRAGKTFASAHKPLGAFVCYGKPTVFRVRDFRLEIQPKPPAPL